MQGIKLSVHFVGARLDIALVTIIGYVDTTTCQELAKIIQDLEKQKRYLIIADLGGVSYVSSAGWGVFVGEIKNIRDRGGDLKIVQMTSEVFEVFEMLEFNRILNFYDSLEEAIDEFDMIRGIDITKVDEAAKRTSRSPAALKYPAMSVTAADTKRKTASTAAKSALAPKDYPLAEKIKHVVLENPIWGMREIQKQLNTEKYGRVKIGWFRLRALAKELNLETKEKRYRYYRSR